jgi:hypothetical protein
MDGLVVALVLVAIFAAVGVLAQLYGTDSRASIDDTHGARSVPGEI